MLEVTIRSEKVSDIAHINDIIRQAFQQENEVSLVNQLRDQGALLFSLVAEHTQTKTLLGHLSLSLVSIQNKNSNKSWQALGLAPISVIPEFQKQGIGSALIRFWFQEYADDFYNAVVLLGDPSYYQRFGFVKASDFNLTWSGGDFKEAFQVKEIKEGFLKKVSGVVYYHEAFNDL